MPVNHLEIKQFRNYQEATFDFTPNMNIIYGSNGTGKTTVLEAIHCLTTTKSFRSAYDKELVNRQENYYQLEGVFSDEDNQDIIQMNYASGQGKKVFLNSREQGKLSDIVGRYPVITLTPEDQEITFGPPAVRRRYVNKILSQASRDHMQRLMQMQSILKQRNAVLQQAVDSPGGKVDENLMEVYNEQLIPVAETVTSDRKQFIEIFRETFRDIFHALSSKDISATITYLPSIDLNTSDQFRHDFEMTLQDRRNQELGFRRTMVGPQTDTFEILFDETNLRKYGSQGEHKLVLIALKLAEGQYLRHVSGKTPIYLFDDLFAELDVTRSKNVLEALDKEGQMLITSTDLGDVREHGIEISGDDITIIDMDNLIAKHRMN